MDLQVDVSVDICLQCRVLLLLYFKFKVYVQSETMIDKTNPPPGNPIWVSRYASLGGEPGQPRTNPPHPLYSSSSSTISWYPFLVPPPLCITNSATAATPSKVPSSCPNVLLPP